MDEKKQLTAGVIETGKTVINIIKADLTGGDYSLPVNCDYKKLFKFAEMHKVTYLIAESVLKSENVPDQIKAVFKKELFKGSMRYAAQEKERKELSDIFASEKIRFCFLKGYKLSRLYKEPEKRYMLDMDVYIEKERFRDAENIIKERGYELNMYQDEKDVGYIKQPFLNIELHKELKYDYDKGYDYYKGAFSRLQKGENEYELNMTNEDFYVYIVSHSAHHFETGGTGIRNILDHYYLQEKLLPLCNKAKLQAALEETGLALFDKRLTQLADYWFKGAEGSEDLEEIAQFIFMSGVFGNQVNLYLGNIIHGNSSNNKVLYYLKRMFPPLSQMRIRYTILKKIPLLLPVFWGVRLLSFTVSKKDVSAEMEAVGSVGEQEQMKFKSFMEKNGL